MLDLCCLYAIGSDVCLTDRINETVHNVSFDEISEEDAGVVVFSSGTTGEPRATLHSCNRSFRGL